MATPVQFRTFARAPQGSRDQMDQRFEQAAGYLSPVDLGIDGVVFTDFPDSATTPPIWSPGFSSFTGLITSTGMSGLEATANLYFLDPLTQTILNAGTFPPTPQLGVDGLAFNFGTGGGFAAPPTSDLIWILWRVVVKSQIFFPATTTVSLEIYANARASR